MNIRQAKKSDYPTLVNLMKDLGYPTTIDKLEIRFDAILEKDNYYTLVAELDGKVVGMAGSYTSLFYEHDGFYVRLVAFVVDRNYRRMGVGKALLKEVENWAEESGAVAVVLNSGNRDERIDAHLFYTNMGYLAKSTGFVKNILK